MTIIKSLEDSGITIDGISETVEKEIEKEHKEKKRKEKEHKGGHFNMC